jgi:uncharacterized protein (TIGR00730 family)
MKWICVFCGSSSGESPIYLEAATRLATLLAREGLGLVYGGSKVGLMGRLADVMLEQGGEVVGVIPQALVNREVGHGGLTELRVVGSMHERKAVMVERSDAFIALPGGLGTLEELFEVVTWGQLGLHRKPSGLLDVNGYYRPLIRFLDHAVTEGFLSATHRRMILVEDDPEVLLGRLTAYDPPTVPKWITVSET